METALRNAFSECSTGNGGPYYPTKGDALCAYEAVLAEYGLCFDLDDDMIGDNGSRMVDVYTDEPECAEFVGSAMLSWYRIDCTGRWEFTGYLI